MLINMSVVRLDGDTQMRVKIDESVVTEYAQMMLNGVSFEPIIVFNDGRCLWLADGFHRFYAAVKNDCTQIDATVKMGNLEEARLFAFAANGHRGESLTAQDIKNIVFKMETHPATKTWTVKQIARHIGKSEATVYRAKRQTRAFPSQLAPTPSAKEPEQEPEKVEDTQELVDTISVLAEENETLKDQLIIAQAGLEEFEKVDVEERFKVMRNRISELELEVRTLVEARNFLQNRNAELVATIKSLKYKIQRMQNAPERLGKVA